MTVKAHLLLDRRPEILNQMKAIGHLLSLRCALSGSLGIKTAAISADDLNRGASLQPCFRALYAAVVQNVDNCSTLEIDDDRAVSCRAPPTPIIYANDPYVGILA